MNHQAPALKRRLWARFIDWAWFVIAVLSMVTAKAVLQCCNKDTSDPPILWAQVLSFQNTSSIEIVLFSMWVATGLIASLCYEVPLVALRGQTVGKMMAGVRVVRIADGRVPGWWRSSLRWAALYGPMLVPVAGWLLTLAVLVTAGLDPDGRGLHDRIAGTIVLGT